VFFVEFTTSDRYTCVDYFTLAKREMYLLAVDSWNQSLYQAASIFPNYMGLRMSGKSIDGINTVFLCKKITQTL
jgi:hypothetical protein